MKKWLPLAKQLLFGWDTTIGIGVFVLVSLIFGEPSRLSTLAIAGFCAYLPDADFVPFLLLRKKLKITVGHWVLGHYPPIVLSLEAVSLWFVSSHVWSGHAVYLVILGVTCTTCHFIHDSTQRGGFHFLAPFTGNGRLRFTLTEPMIWNHYRVHWSGIRKQSDQDIRTIYVLTATWAEKDDGSYEIIARTEPLTRRQMIGFVASITGLILLGVIHGMHGRLLS